MAWIASNDAAAKQLGDNGRKRVEEHFSFDAFAKQLTEEVETLLAVGGRGGSGNGGDKGRGKDRSKGKQS